MDRAIHTQWLRAERRIDLALAGLMASALWIVVLPIIVAMTDIDWSSSLTVLLAMSLPAAALCVRPLRIGLMVARAIEKRDKTEIERWRTSRVPPAEAELLKQRMRRVHYPMLWVIVGAGAIVGAVSLHRSLHAVTPGMQHFAGGIAVGALGVMLGSLVFMATGKVSSRAMLGLLVLVGWLVPVGGGLASLGVIFGRQDLEAAIAVRALTTASYVIFGIVGMLAAVVLLAAWFAWVTAFLAGRGLEVDGSSRVLPDVVGEERAPEAFDAEDLHVLRAALDVERADLILITAVAVGSIVVLVLAAMGFAGAVVRSVGSGMLGIGLVGTGYRAVTI